jgi:hypothetical protein
MSLLTWSLLFLVAVVAVAFVVLLNERRDRAAPRRLHVLPATSRST